MSRYLKKLVSLPVRSLAEYLIDRFLGKFVGKIDLTREGTHFDKETLTLPDLNLNCRVLNESMQHTPLKFVKFHIGTLILKMLNLRNGQVQVSIKDVEIDFELQNETFAKTQPQNGSSQEQKTKSSKIGHTDRRRELFLVDMLVSNVLTNLEINLENLAIRVVTRETESLEEKVPTFLIRTHAISFSSHKCPEQQFIPPAPQQKIDPLLPMSDLQCLLGNKKFSISDISVHLMREKWLDPLEHFKVGQFNTHFNAFSFPFDYPTLNHPSTILLIKAPLGVKELATAAKTVKLRDGYDFLPAIQVQFKQNEPGHLSCGIEIPLIEAQVSIGQLSEILRVIKALKQKQGQPCRPSLSENHALIDEPSGMEHFKADFANSIVRQNPELMASMHEMFESQQQDYLMYSSMYDSSVTAPVNNKIFNMMGTSSADFRTAPLIGKGDGYSQEAALKDSMHPDMLHESIDQKSETQRMVEEEASFGSSNAYQQLTQNKLPVKQPLNQITIEMRLGEFLSTVLASEEPLSSYQERDGLDQVLDELIHEQGARNKEAIPCESSPFVADHDRVFKAFGEQVNSEYSMQKFHLPERVKHDSSQIKSQWFEVKIQEFDVSLQITREEDIVKQIKAIGGVQNIICQRIDAILQTSKKRIGSEDANRPAGNSSLMDITLLSSDSDKFHSCYTHANDSTVYHDMSQFGMGSMVIAESVNPTDHQAATKPNKIKNLFTFSQLTNVVSPQSQMGTFHVCRNILLEVVKLKKDSQKCLQFSSIRNFAKERVMKQDTKVLLGKIFTNLGQSEVLLALSIKSKSEIEEESNYNKDSERPQEQKVSIGVQIDGLELDFSFSPSGDRVMDILETLTKRTGTMQEVLAQVPCKCSVQDAQSLGFNTTQINLVIIPDKEPSCKLKQADLVAKISGQNAPIALLTVHNLILKATMLETYQKEEDKSNTRANQNQRTKNKKDDESPLLFRRTSSSYDESKEEEERKSQMRQSFHYNSNVVHLIDEPCQVQITLRVQQLAILIDHRDLLGPIADYLTSIEGQVKNLLNVVDTANVVSVSKIKDRELFFIAKRDKVSPSIQFTTVVDDLTIQALYEGTEAVKLRLDKTHVDFKMQDRGSIANFAFGVRVHDFIIVDQMQKVYAYYQIGKYDKDNGQPDCKLYKPPIRYLSLMEETDHSTEFLLVHSSQELHSRPLLTCDVQLSFLNEAYMEERILLEDLRSSILALMSNTKDGQQANRQIYLDFAEMKKNPAQVVCSGVVSHLTINISNQNLALSQKLSKVAKKAVKVFNRLRSKKGLVDLDETSKLVPRASTILQSNFEESHLKLQLRDLTLIYTPVLSRSNLTSAFGSEPNDDLSFDSGLLITSQMKEDFDQQLFRLNRHMALHLNHLQTGVQPKEKKFELRVRSLAVHYLTENCHPLSKTQLANWQTKFQTWRLQGRQNIQQKCSTSQQELQRRGFVPLVALTDFMMVFKRMQLAVKLNSVSFSFAEDSLHDFISFLRLVQVSIGEDLVRLEDNMDQQVSLQDSLITESGNANTTMYQGQGLDKSQLSLIREQSMIHEESMLLTRHEQSVSASKTSDDQPSIMFGDEHPFRQMVDDEDMFIVSITTTQQPARRPQASNNPFAKREHFPNRVCLLSMIDQNYFAQPAESQSKLDQQRFRKIHDLSEQMRQMVCSLSFSFELGSLRLVLFCGQDFAFDNTISQSSSKRPANTLHRISEKIMDFPTSTSANHSLCLANTMQERGNSRLFSGASRQQSLAVNRETIARSRVSQIGVSEDKQVMLLEDNYIDENELAEERPEEYSRARTAYRKHNLFAKLEVQDLLVTRRHFPDQACLDERKVNKKETPKRGLKFKTFALSARDFQINFSHDKGCKYLLESPYSFRHHNIIELTVQSEKSYEKNIEEHSILLFLRPSKVTVDRETIDFIDKMLKVTLAQSMEGLKVTKSRDDFEVIEEEEIKEAVKPVMGQLFESNQIPNSPERKVARTLQLIRNLVIKETSLTLSVSLTKLISFQNLTIPIREFRLQNSELSQFLVVDQAPGLPIQTVQNCVVKFYKSDIIRNQKLAILKSFRPVQGLTFFGGSILSPIYKPLLHGYQFGLNGFLVGLSEGFGDVYTLLAQSTYDWSVYFVQIRRL